MKEKEKCKKGENLNYKKLNMQTYLVSDKINSRDAIFLFKIRTQMLDVRKNYESKYENNMTCQLCLSHTDTQQDIITCLALNTENRKITVKYNDLFSNDLNTVASALKKYKSLWKRREHIMSNK